MRSPIRAAVPILQEQGDPRMMQFGVKYQF
jgi:hypothetical protein